ncbi:MAG: hypothetical protein AB1756_04520 [Acidobacteriota bacterium]
MKKYKNVETAPNVDGVRIVFCSKDPLNCALECSEKGCEHYVAVTIDTESAASLANRLKHVLYNMGWKE